MRLGEVKSKIDPALNEEGKIILEYEAIYGGQAYQVENYGDVTNALKILRKFEWNQVDFSEIDDFLDGAERITNTKTMKVNDYSQLSNFVSNLNVQLPYFYSIISSMVDEQNEQTINIKLHEEPVSLDELSDFNKRIGKLFKEFQVDGDFKFAGFDKGSAWYVIIIAGVLTFRFFITCLKTAQEIFKTKKEYYNSAKAKLDYEASLSKGDKFDEGDFKKYQERRLELEVEEEVEKTIEYIGETNGAKEIELKTKLIIATKELIKELEKGTEFHLSLNPPDYAKEQKGYLEINYKSLKYEKPVLQLKSSDKDED